MVSKGSIWFIVYLLALFFGSTALLMGQLVSVSTAQLAEEAHGIYRGKVKAVTSEWNDEKNFIWSFVTFSVSETVKGEDISGKDIEIKIPGGVVGEIGQRSSDQVTFEEGEEAVVFLGTEKYKDKDYYNVVRLVQGKYTIEEGKIQEKSVEAFMQDVTRALEQQKEEDDDE